MVLILNVVFALYLKSAFGGVVLQRSNSTNRIVGGVSVPAGRYVPYQVSLQYFSRKQEYQHFCGGSILSADRILTAAHCCQGLNPQRMSVLAGVKDLNDSENGTRSQVINYEIHPNYEELRTSDIALITIHPPFELNDASIAAIKIYNEGFVPGGVKVTLTGWGLRLPVQFPFLPDNVNYPSVLQTMTYNTITNRECRYKGITDLTDTEICAEGFPFKGACLGDSGGPLVMSTRHGTQQVGIVSYGLFICGVFDVPDVYTRVSEFNLWLRERMSPNSIKKL
uniref:Lectizyme n=1 Tax=Glossina morsitans morsitans TaxID=37546 RepID=A0A1B0G6R2_GLOMM